MSSIIWSVLKWVFGSALQWYRSRPKVVVTTHDSSHPNNRIDISITNQGKSPVVVRSWTVHIKMDFPPSLAEVIQEYNEEEKQTGNAKRSLVGSVIEYITLKCSGRARAETMRRLLAQGILGKPHWECELLEQGTTQRIGPGESAARLFIRPATCPPTPSTPESSLQTITFVPSCRIVGLRRRVWRLPSSVIVDNAGSIVSAMHVTYPLAEDED